MSEQSWWLVLLVFEIIGLWGQYIVGMNRWWGWGVVMLHSIPWFVFSLVSQNWGAMMMPPLWWSVNGYNLFKWRNNVHS